jgi:hypothetical protein
MMITEAHNLASLYLTTAGHSLWQELGVKNANSVPAERTATMWADQRAEAMLLGCLLIEGEPAAEACRRAHLQPAAFTQSRFATAYPLALAGKRVGAALCAYCTGEYIAAFEELCKRGIYHPAPDVAFALAQRTVKLAGARQRIREADRLLNGYEVA